MARRLFVLLPPSESKEAGGSRSRKPGTFDVALDAPRSEVAQALGALVQSGRSFDIERTLRVHGVLLERAIESSRAVAQGRARLLPAWRRYNGVVWSHLDPVTLSSAHRRRILVPSGLYGVTTAQDHIGDYRMKMNVVLAPMGGLATFWRPRLTPTLVEHLKGAIVVNLLPKEHGAAIDFAEIGKTCHVITIRFVVEGEVVVAGHEAKAVKGILARQLLSEGLDALDAFDWQGWRSDQDGRGHRMVATRGRATEVAVVFRGQR